MDIFSLFISSKG